MVETVRSPQNEKLKLARSIRSGKERGLTLLEGRRVIADALEAGVVLRWLLVDEARAESSDEQDLLARAQSSGAEVSYCESGRLKADSDLNSPSGSVGCCEIPACTAEDVLAGEGPVLVSAGVQEPGNVGALVRVAAGLRATGVVTFVGGASAWSPRALRGASGTTLRIPIADRVQPDHFWAVAREQGATVWAASGRGDDLVQACAAYRSHPSSGPLVILLGREGSGLEESWLDQADQRISIPMTQGVESLNVATAAAVFFWELSRDR